jgi:hypothetical protein
MAEHKIGVSIIGEDKASGSIKQVQSALSNLGSDAKSAGNTTSDAFKKAKSGVEKLGDEVKKAGSSFTVLKGAASVFLGELAIKIQSLAIKAVKMLVREMIQLGKEMIKLGLESNTSAKSMFDNFNTQVTNLKRLFGEELVVTIGPALQEIATRISELITTGKLDPLVESFGNLAQKVVEMGPKIWDLAKALLGVTSDEEAIDKIANAFDRVGYAVEQLNTLLDRTAYLVDKLNLDKIASFISAGTPGGTLWNALGAGVEAQSTTSQNSREGEENITTTAKLEPAIVKETNIREQQSQAITKNIQGTLAQNQAVEMVSENLGGLGGAMASTIKMLDDALCAIGKKRAEQYSSLSRCSTWGVSGWIVESTGQDPISGTLPENTQYPRGLWDVGAAVAEAISKGNYTVNDALITKKGDIVKLHPDDNIMAFKGNSPGGTSNITINVNGAGDPDRIAEQIMRKIERINRVK